MSRTRYQPRKHCVSWDEHHNSVMDVFQELLNNNSLVDCTLSAEGQFLKAHKLVLSACSAYFQTLFNQENEKNPVIILKDTKFQELKAIVDFIYCGKVIITEDQLPALTSVAESLQIKGFKKTPREDVSKKAVHLSRREKSTSPVPRKRSRNSSNNNEDNPNIPHDELIVGSDKDEDFIDVVDDQEDNNTDSQNIPVVKEKSKPNTHSSLPAKESADTLTSNLSSRFELSSSCHLQSPQAECDDESDVKPMFEIFLPEPDFADDMYNQPQASSSSNNTKEKNKGSEQSNEVSQARNKCMSPDNIPLSNRVISGFKSPINQCLSTENSQRNIATYQASSSSMSSSSPSHLEQLLQGTLPHRIPLAMTGHTSEDSSQPQSERIGQHAIYLPQQEQLRQKEIEQREMNTKQLSVSTPQISSQTQNVEVMPVDESRADSREKPAEAECIIIDEDDSVDSLPPPQSTPVCDKENTKDCSDEEIICLQPQQLGREQHLRAGQHMSDILIDGNLFATQPGAELAAMQMLQTLKQYKGPNEITPGTSSLHPSNQGQQQKRQKVIVKTIAVPTDKVNNPQSLEEFLNSGVMMDGKNLSGLPPGCKFVVKSCNPDVPLALINIVKGVNQAAEYSSAAGPSASSFTSSSNSPYLTLPTTVIAGRDGVGCSFNYTREPVGIGNAISNLATNTVTHSPSSDNIQTSNFTSIPQTSINTVTQARTTSTTTVANTVSAVPTGFANIPITESQGPSLINRTVKNTPEKHLCKKCTLEFTSFANLKKHVLTAHKGTFVYECPGCNPCLSKKSNSIVYKCPLCQLEFPTYSFLKSHFGTHTKVLNHFCPRCDAPK